MWLNLLWLVVGGSWGIIGRYGAVLLLGKQQLAGFPASTFAVNMLGSLVIGFLWSWLDDPHMTEATRNLLFVGFLGGFTTFSSYALEVMQLYQSGDIRSALLYVLASNLLGIALAFVGFWMGSKVYASAIFSYICCNKTCYYASHHYYYWR